MMRAISVQQRSVVEPQVFVQTAGDGDMAAVQNLLAAGAEVNAAGAYGKTALIAAAAQGHVEIVRLLLRHNANVNVQKSDGFSALISAVFFGHEEVVRVLLEHGADVFVKDQTGATAHSWALSRGLTTLAQVLKKAEVKTPAPVKAEGKTAAPAPVVVVRSITQYDEADAVLDLDDEPVTRELKPLPSATRAPQLSAVEPAAQPATLRPLPLVLPRVVEPVTAPLVLPPSEQTLSNIAPVEREVAKERAQPVRRTANFSPEVLRATFARFKAEVTMRQLAAAFVIGIVAGSILAYAITPQRTPTAAARPPIVEPASPAETSAPAQLPPAASAVTERELKATAPQTPAAIADQRSSSTAKPLAQKTSGASAAVEPVISAKPNRATTEKSATTQRAASPPPVAAEPELKQLAPPPVRIVSEPVKENREAVTTPRKITAPVARTERPSVPPPAAPQPTASPAKKVIRWP